MAKRAKTEYPTIDAATVWAAACAAQRVNGTYNKVKVLFGDPENPQFRNPNKDVMREFFMNPTMLTDADYQQGEEVRTYWRNKLMDVLTGTANSFTSQAVELASKEEFKANDWLALATIAYLPFGYEKGKIRDEQQIVKMEAVMVSEHFGEIKDKISGTATVVDCRYSQNWGTYYISAKFGTNLILFAYRKHLEAGQEINFTGTIRAHRDDNVTQLNRVKIN